MVVITIPSDYSYVLLAVLTLGFECIMIGFIYGGGSRKNTFGKKFMDSNFLKEHQEAFGKDSSPDPNGYPDTGSGRYSKALTYKKWYDFNSNQRAHLNAMETIVQHTFFIMIAGLQSPRVAAAFGALAIIGRYLYATGYS